MAPIITCDADEALEKLKAGNMLYLTAKTSDGDISPALRKKTCIEGQAPYAVIVTCSDSRVIPESIFSAGIGELFVIRVAGNVIDNHQLASIEYATEHLGSRLIVVMGHIHCGAVQAAITGNSEGYIRFITDEIQRAIGSETDDYKACCLNVQHSIQIIRQTMEIPQNSKNGLQVHAAVYHLDDGHVEFL